MRSCVVRRAGRAARRVARWAVRPSKAAILAALALFGAEPGPALAQPALRDSVTMPVPGTPPPASDAARPPASDPARPPVAAPMQPPTSATATPLPVTQPAEWETLAAGLPEEYRLEPLMGFRYNRVDGPAPSVGLVIRNEVDPLALIRAQATYAISRERLLAEFGADVPVGHRRRVSIGASGYRRTASEDAWIVSEAENTIFALLSRKDYRDYYEAEGFEGHVAVEPGRDAGVFAGLRLEDQRPLDVGTRVAAWGVDDLFRANPAIDSGEEGSVWGGFRIGPASIPAAGGSRVEVRYERAGTPIERDFTYERVRIQGNLRARLAPGQGFRARVVVGSTRSGTLTAQKVWDLGGIGTLRGEPFKSQSGDQFYLASAEYAYLFRKNLHAVALLDWGAAFYGKGAWSESRPAVDGGLGIRIAEGPAMVTLSRNLQRSDAPFLVGVRLGATWE